MTKRDYSTRSRREHIQMNAARYRYDMRDGYSLREIAFDIKQAFELPKPPSPATIRNDMAKIASAKATHKITASAVELLLPENFTEWRAEHFEAPDGDRYVTPIHQLAWFHLIASLALKRPLPQWVVDWYKKETDIDLDIDEWAEDPKWLMTVVILAPPRHGKTDLFQHAMIWLICVNPNIRIIWAARVLSMAEEVIGYVKRELEANGKLIARYGPFENEGQWSDTQFTVATRTRRMRAPTMRPQGKGSTVLSKDADIIIFDDIHDLKDAESPTQVGKDLRWMKTQLLTRREKWTPVLGIGSHQPAPHGDLYEEWERDQSSNPNEHSRVRFVRLRAHRYDRCRPGDTDDEKHGEWCLLWPEYRPFWFLEAQRHDLTDMLFEVCYNQEPRRGAITYFREKVVRGDYQQPVYDPELRRYRDPDRTQGVGILDRHRSWGMIPECCQLPAVMLLVTLGFDPASGETRHAAESALIVLAGCRTCGRRYVIDMWHDRVSPEGHPDTINVYANQHSVWRVRIEINAYQKALARDPRLRDYARLGRWIIDEWMTDEKKTDPALGIPLLSRYMEEGKFSVPYAFPQDQEKAEILLRQLTRFPLKPNDTILALWLADLSLSLLIHEMANNQPVHTGDDGDIPQYLLDQRVTVDMSDMSQVMSPHTQE